MALDFEEDKTLVWDLSLPDDLVEGSARAWVTAIGDLMGPALQVRNNKKSFFFKFCLAKNKKESQSDFNEIGAVWSSASSNGLR